MHVTSGTGPQYKRHWATIHTLLVALGHNTRITSGTRPQYKWHWVTVLYQRAKLQLDQQYCTLTCNTTLVGCDSRSACKIYILGILHLVSVSMYWLSSQAYLASYTNMHAFSANQHCMLVPLTDRLASLGPFGCLFMLVLCLPFPSLVPPPGSSSPPLPPPVKPSLALPK